MDENNRKEALTLSMDEAARLLGVSRYSVYTRIKKGELPFIRIGKVYRIPKVKLLKMIDGGDSPSSVDQCTRSNT